MYRPRDILDPLLALIFEREVKLVTHLIVHEAADADAARFGKCFEARCDIYSITEDVVLLDDHVAEIDANPKRDVPLVWNISLALRHPALDLYSAAHGVHNARELRQ